MYEELLSEIGMTKSEIAVYFALLELGSSTTGSIIKKADIASGKAYLILNKLIEKGLVTYVIKSGTKYYQAKDPERILDYLKEKQNNLKQKEEEIKKIIPKLKKDYEERKYKQKAEIYEGVKGFKTFYEFVLKELKKGDIVFILGAPKEAAEKFDVYFLDWHKRRIKLGINLRILYNHDCKAVGKKRQKLKLTKIKYMKEDLETPAWIFIFKDYTATINVRDEPIVFLIKSKETANSYRQYFEILWKQAKP